jgi:hypothetical protein
MEEAGEKERRAQALREREVMSAKRRERAVTETRPSRGGRGSQG